MATGMELVKRQASNKGYVALASLAATGLLFWLFGWLLAIPGLGLSAYFGYRWFTYRAKWGLRF